MARYLFTQSARATFAFILLALLGACTSPPPRQIGNYRPSDYTRGYGASGGAPQAPSRIATTPITSNYYPQNQPPVRAESLILIDGRSGKVLAQKGADFQRAVASTQKLVTAMLIVDRGRLDERVVIQPEDTRVEPSKLYLKPGESYTRRELLNAILVKSANDAAMALARDHSGSAAAFAQRMTQKARSLGAHNSSFRNPHGLTQPGQFSTARDLAKIAYAASRYSFIRQAVRQQSYVFHTPRGPRTLKSTNKLLARMPNCTGLKTGYTRASGRCLITTASFGGKNLILVQLGSETKYIFDDAERLMNWASGHRTSSGSFAMAPLP